MNYPSHQVHHNSKDSYARISKGLTLDSLATKALPKNLKAKLCPNHKENLTKSTYTRDQSPTCNSQLLNPASLDSYMTQLTQRKLNSNNSTLRSKSAMHMNKQNRYTRIRSPTSSIFKSYRCHKYHTDLDFNYLTNKKFQEDAKSCAKERLSTIALRNSSPEKYTGNPYTRNLYQKKINRYVTNRGESVNIDGYLSEEEKNPQSFSRMSHPNHSKLPSQSQNVLSNVLDNQFSINSPSKLKLFQTEMDQLKVEEFKKTFHKDNSGCGDRIYAEAGSDGEEQNTKLSINLSYVGDNPMERYMEALEQMLNFLDPVLDKLSLNERIEKFLNLLDDQRRSIRLGAIVSLYVTVKKYQIEDKLRLTILEKVISLLHSYGSLEELFLVACLELCGLYGPCDLLLDNIGLICMFITDFNFPKLQRASFMCLMSLEYEGIRTLVELASKDYGEYQQFILTSLLDTPHIQQIIIVRALLNEIYSKNPERQHSALAAINRMYDLISDPDALGKLAKFYHQSKLEKIFLSSCLRTAGPEGEKILLHEIKTNKDFSVRVAIASVLSYRFSKSPRYLEMRLDQNDTYAVTRTLPGSFCTYYGKVSPVIYEDEDNTLCDEAYLEVSTRDFLAALQRMLGMNYDHTNPKIVHSGEPNLLDSLNLDKENDILLKHKEFYSYSEPIEEFGELNEKGKYLITEDVIKALCQCLKDYSTAVRDTAASALGQIGLPEGLIAINYLCEAINDSDVNVKAKAIWAIGRVAQGCDASVAGLLVEALKSNMWKVKSACLFALSQFGHRAARQALPVLVKLLKESAINKQTIAETMVKMGVEGETTLLKLMSKEDDSNYKLKGSILKALALSDVTSPNIDFIVECLYKAGESNSSILRKCSLFSLRELAEKAQESVTYLKRKNIIPFYYEKMLDKDVAIQAYAIECIGSLGAQGELIFIEGLIKDINPTVRMNCAVGLGELGVHTLRTLLVGLHDENLQVRRTVARVITTKFNIDDILNYYCDSRRESQRMSLKIALKDTVEKDLHLKGDHHYKNFFKDLLTELEKEMK